MVQRLSAGDAFPAVTFALPDGGSTSVPDDLGDGYKVVLVFRGSW